VQRELHPDGLVRTLKLTIVDAAHQPLKL